MDEAPDYYLSLHHFRWQQGRSTTLQPSSVGSNVGGRLLNPVGVDCQLHCPVRRLRPHPARGAEARRGGRERRAPCRTDSTWGHSHVVSAGVRTPLRIRW